MTPEAVQPATATQTATSIELKSDRVTVTFDPATGMISRITSGGTEVPFKDGPVAVGMKMRYEPTLSYVRNSNEGAVYCAKYQRCLRLHRMASYGQRITLYGCHSAEPGFRRRWIR